MASAQRGSACAAAIVGCGADALDDEDDAAAGDADGLVGDGPPWLAGASGTPSWMFLLRFAMMAFNACDQMQGFLFSEPLPADEAEEFMRTEQTKYGSRETPRP